MAEVGDRNTYNGQIYDCVAIVAHTNLHGQAAPYSLWEAKCANPECATRFQQGFPPNFPVKSVVLKRRCDAHIKPGVPVDPDRVRSKRGRATATFEAVAFLVLIRGASHRAISTQEYVSAVKANYPNMEPEVAVALGSDAETDSARYQAVLRVLRVAQDIKRLGATRAGKVMAWDYTVQSDPERKPSAPVAGARK